MERLRFDPYDVGTSRYVSRRMGEQSPSSCPVSKGQGCPVNSRPQPTAEVTEEGLAQAFILSQASIFPQYELCEALKRGTLFVSLDKPLEGVNCCGTR